MDGSEGLVHVGVSNYANTNKSAFLRTEGRISVLGFLPFVPLGAQFIWGYDFRESESYMGIRAFIHDGNYEDLYIFMGKQEIPRVDSRMGTKNEIANIGLGYRF